MEKFSQIFYLIFILSGTYSYFILPFNNQDFFEDNSKELNNVTAFLNAWSSVHFHSDLYIGTPPQKTTALLISSNPLFFVSNYKESKYMLNIYDFSKSETFSYSQENSTIDEGNESIVYLFATDTINILENEGELDEIYSNKNMYIIDSNKYKEIKRINFFFAYNQKESKKCISLIGFSPFPKKEKHLFIISLLIQLYNLSLINLPIWSIQFHKNKDNEGNIIIGSYPHEYDPLNYFEDQLVKIKFSNLSYDYYTMNIENAYLSKTYEKEIGEIQENDSILSTNFIVGATLEFEVHFMHAPYELFLAMTSFFFNKYFENNKCFFKKIETSQIAFIYCDKKTFTMTDMIKFPSLNFYIKEYDYTFKIDYNDAFKERGDFIFLLILFEPALNYLRLGQMFMKKYMFTFDFDNFELGFYKKNPQDNIRYYSASFKKFLKDHCTLMIFLLLVFIFIIIFMIRKSYKKKKIMETSDANKNVAHFPDDDINQGYELKNDDQ